MQNDPFGRVSIMQFFNYVMRKVWLHQTRIGLSLYDVAGQGYLKESVSLCSHVFVCVHACVSERECVCVCAVSAEVHVGMPEARNPAN